MELNRRGVREQAARFDAASVAVEEQPREPLLQRASFVRALERQSRGMLLALDATILLGAGIVTHGGLAGIDAPARRSFVIFSALVLLLFTARGLYRRRLQLRVLDEARDVVTTTAVAAMAALSIQVLVGERLGLVGAGDHALGAEGARLWGIATVGLVLARIGFGSLRSGLRNRIDPRPPTLIVGAGRVGRLIARRLAASRDVDLRPIGFLDDDPLECDEDVRERLPVLGGSRDLESIVSGHGVEHVVLAFSGLPNEELLRIATRCEQLDVPVSYVPRLFERMSERLEIQHLGGLPLISAQTTDPNAWRFATKHALDRVLAAALVVAAAPALLVTTLAVWISLGRPILYRQVRVGRDGRPFEMLKFRSMRPGQELHDPRELPADTAPGGVEGEDRRTRVGRVIRQLSLDEFPQLINVLRGEMSLVGPRPERPEFAESFALDVHRYDDRHRVRSGITGWAQVHGLRGKTSVADRAEWDNYYIDNWSFWLDVKILLLTVVALARSLRE